MPAEHNATEDERTSTSDGFAPGYGDDMKRLEHWQCVASGRPGIVAAATLAALLFAPAFAHAADPAPSSGFYAGGHAGYLFGTANATLGDPTGGATAGGTTPFGSLFGGVQVGYEHVFPSRLMLGVEADVSFS